MDWTTVALLVVVGGFLLWNGHSREKNDERAEAATKELERDNHLYQNIKTGLRECQWREQQEGYRRIQDGELLFENAHMTAYHVSHFAESRTGFYFKDRNEYGLYGFFAGNGDEFFESYYRTDKTFKDEGRLLHDED